MLPDVRIASPCTASWESMTGNDRSRHCSECNRNVYNFAEMTSAEIEQLIAASNGERLCGRMYRRTDGTILTSDCPVGLQARIRHVSRRLSVALAAVMSVSWIASASPQQDNSMMGDVAIAQSGVNLSVVHNESPVTQAQIKIIDLRDNQVVANGKSDNAGKFGLALTPGEYRILVESPRLMPHSVAVSVQPHRMQSVSVSLQNRGFTTGIIAPPQKKFQQAPEK